MIKKIITAFLLVLLSSINLYASEPLPITKEEMGAAAHSSNRRKFDAWAGKSNGRLLNLNECNNRKECLIKEEINLPYVLQFFSDDGNNEYANFVVMWKIVRLQVNKHETKIYFLEVNLCEGGEKI